MNCGKRNISIVSAFLLSVLLITMNSTGWGQEDDERRKLLDQQKALTGKIEDLRHEQDYLLFLKALSSTDSKYLIFTISSRTGRLKYKNRVLKDFRFSDSLPRKRMERGEVTLTKKNEFSKSRKELVFGKSFILQRKGFEVRENLTVPRLLLSKKDFRAVFNALEEGSRAYVIP